VAGAVAALLLVPLLLLGACTSSGSDGSKSDGTTQSSDDTSGGPTDADVKATIEKQFGATYGIDNGGAQFKDISFDFGPISHGKPAMRYLDGGPQRKAWAVKVVVTMTITYSNNPTVKESVRGKDPDDAFFFYKDDFGDWAFRTGTP
jgi:hypothetical protein